MRFAVLQYSETRHLSLSPYRNEISIPIETKFQSYTTKEMEIVSVSDDHRAFSFGFVPRNFSHTGSHVHIIM